MSLFLPTANVSNQFWTPTPSGPGFTDLWQHIDDPHPGAEADSTYLTGPTFIFDGVICTFPFPTYFSAVSYGDGTTMVPDGVHSVTLHARIRGDTGSVTPFWAVIRSSFPDHYTQFSVTSTSFSNLSQTYTADPFTGASWTLADLATTQFAVFANDTDTPRVELARLLVHVVESTPPGQSRARLGPLLHEPSLFCAICNLPFHVSSLTRITDPLHPQDEKWVCRDDIDGSIHSVEDLLRGTKLTEGDIDFDL